MIGQKYALFRKQPNFCSRKWITSQGDTRPNMSGTWYVTHQERGEKGTLIASGFIAGGALMGVVSALLKFGGVDLMLSEWVANPLSQIASLAAYLLLVTYFIKATK